MQMKKLSSWHPLGGKLLTPPKDSNVCVVHGKPWCRPLGVVIFHKSGCKVDKSYKRNYYEMLNYFPLNNNQYKTKYQNTSQ